MIPTRTSKPIEVLLLTQAPAKMKIAHAILRDADVNIWVCLSVVNSEAQAADFLQRRQPWQDARRPDLVLVESAGPAMDGPAVPDGLRRAALEMDIPLIPLSGPADVACPLADALCRRCHASASVSVDHCHQAFHAVKDVWRGLAAVAVS